MTRMNINSAYRIALSPDNYDTTTLQAAFDRLSEPQMAGNVKASDARKILWETDRVNLED